MDKGMSRKGAKTQSKDTKKKGFFAASLRLCAFA
jgi:hypothetical protein